MKPRPRGKRFRNLTPRGGVLYYQRQVAGGRFRWSCQTDDWELAAKRARQYDALSPRLEPPPAPVRSGAPTLCEMAQRYLAEDVGHLAATTRGDRRTCLRAHGPLMAHFADWPLEEIRPKHLREWWTEHVERAGRSPKTGREYLNAVAAVFNYAMDLELVERSPVSDFRAQLRRRSRTKRGRAEAKSKIRPLTDVAAIGRMLEAAHARSLQDHALILCMLDAGLRLGEASALTWGQIQWGTDAHDRTRCLVIDRSRPRGETVELMTKSGRDRQVPLSRRLRSALRELHFATGRPGLAEQLFPNFDPHNFRRRRWSPICDGAGIKGHSPKDLRDTFASWLVSLGAPLPFVQRALGHATWAVTAQHYARWVPEAEFINPPRLEPGDVWPDLLARLAAGRNTASQG